MRRVLFGLACAALLSGCATSQMKSTPFYSGSPSVYTGNPEDRVNLWPLGYYREPALSVLWPVFSLTDDHLALRPLYSQYRSSARADYDEFNLLWPLAQLDTRRDSGRVFPVYWGRNYFHVFPLLWNSGDNHVLFPLAWWWDGGAAFTLFPVFWWARDRHLAVLPFYYQDKETLVAFPFYARAETADNLTVWYGPAGRRTGKGGDSDWCVPFYYRDDKRFETPLFGWDDRSSWAFPIYYGGSDGLLISPLWASWRDRKSGKECRFIPPLLTYFDDAGNLFTPLGGVDGTASWATLLYYYDSQTKQFISLPFIHNKSVTGITPFIGWVHGLHLSGAWLWPLFGWTSDDRMAEAERLLAAERLDPKVTLKRHEHVYRHYTNRWYEVRGATNVRDKNWQLCWLSGGERRVSWSMTKGTNTPRRVVAEDRRSFGNLLVYRSAATRTVTFDPDTRERLSDSEVGESGALCHFLWHAKRETSAGRDYRMRSVLWRFWHYENLNGDVTVDSFPFFTYDAKTNGYSKVAVLGRLFRNEVDPVKGRSVDVLFVPCWRDRD